jgi:hypothetical protein
MWKLSSGLNLRILNPSERKLGFTIYVLETSHKVKKPEKYPLKEPWQ